MEYSVANRKIAKLVFVFCQQERGQSFLILDTRYINMILVYKYDFSRYFRYTIIKMLLRMKTL